MWYIPWNILWVCCVAGVCLTIIYPYSQGFLHRHWGDLNVCPNASEATLNNVWVETYPNSKLHWSDMGPIWGRQDPGGPHVGPINLAIWVTSTKHSAHFVHKQRVLMHGHQGWNVRHGLCHIYMRYVYIYELFIAFASFVVCSLL